MTVEWGDFWSGNAQIIRARLSFKYAPWFRVRLEVNQTLTDLFEGKFTARILNSTFSFSASPQLTFSNLVQNDNRSRSLGWQSRIRWTPKQRSIRVTQSRLNQ